MKEKFRLCKWFDPITGSITFSVQRLTDGGDGFFGNTKNIFQSINEINARECFNRITSDYDDCFEIIDESSPRKCK